RAPAPYCDAASAGRRLVAGGVAPRAGRIVRSAGTRDFLEFAGTADTVSGFCRVAAPGFARRASGEGGLLLEAKMVRVLTTGRSGPAVYQTCSRWAGIHCGDHCADA